MRFEPPRCPYPPCRDHFHPTTGFSVRRGWYRARCRDERIPRFRCKSCRRTFSRQTFRHDYRDKRPATNGPLFRLLVSSVSLRQASRLLGLDIRTVVQKLAKAGVTCAAMLANVASRLPEGRALALDEVETSEGAAARSVKVPIVVDRESTFVVAYDAAPARPLARPTGGRRGGPRDPRSGPQPDRRRACLERVVAAAAARLPGAGPIVVHTKDSPRFGRALQRHFGQRLVHVRVGDASTPGGARALAPIQRTIAMGRDNCARLRPRTWSRSKKRAFLLHQLHLFAAYVNLQRRRYNHDLPHRTPACVLGLLPRDLTPEQILGWRQDWGGNSSHPLDPSGRRRIGDPGAT